jgi:hypothetical protein
MSLRRSSRSASSNSAQDLSIIGDRLLKLDALLEAISIGVSPMVAADGLDEAHVEELIDVAKHLLREADTAFCNYNEWRSTSMHGLGVRTQVDKLLQP